MSTFENDLRLEEIGTGERAGTWGTATNTNLELIANALSYSSTGEAIPNASTHTLTMVDGAADEFRSLYLKCTGGGQACTVTLAPNTLSKVWMIENTTSHTLTFSQGSGANVAVLAGQVKVIATNGVGNAGAVFDLMQDLSVPDLFVDNDLTLQSDAAVLGFGANKDVTLTHVHDAGLLLNAAMKIQFRDAALSIGSSADGQLDIIADTEIQIAATTIDINGAINASGEIIAASLDISGNVDVDGTLETDALSLNGTAVTSTAAELNILDGKAFLDEDNLASNSATGIASQQSIKAYVDGITTTNIVSTGALNSGSITSGFGNIDNGSSTISTTGLISGGSLDIDSVLINGATIGHTDDTDLITLADGVVTVAGEVSVTTLDIGGTNVTSTAAELNILDGVTSTAAELNILDGVTSTAAELNILDGVTSTAAELNVLDGVTAVVGELNALDLGSTAIGTAVVSKAVVLDANKDYTGIRNFSITGDLSIGGSSTIVDSVTMTANNAVVFEGATADAHETTLTSVDATADRTISLPNVSGTIPVLAAVSTVAITSTPEELNILDGVTSTAAELNLLDGVTSTTAELNILDGVTSTAAELNLVDGLVGIVAKTSATGSALLPTGNTAQRDGSPTTGAFRFNSTLTAFEGYNGSAWGSVGGGATGGVGNEMFYENDQIADASYTIPANRNAMTTGPITIADGVTITVSDGSRLVVI